VGFLSVWESEERADRAGVPDEIDLFEAVTEILNEISDAEL
jgi:hypothetical protein